jgi:hypothetical protein
LHAETARLANAAPTAGPSLPFEHDGRRSELGVRDVRRAISASR